MIRSIPFVFLLAVILVSCKKGPGEGGSSSITGYVKVVQYNAFYTQVLGEHDGADEEVFIIYGDDISYGDRLWTSPDGRFEFKYLRKGNYRVYVYSGDTTLSDTVGKIPVIHNVEITGNDQVVDAGTFIIKRN